MPLEVPLILGRLTRKITNIFFVRFRPAPSPTRDPLEADHPADTLTLGQTPEPPQFVTTAPRRRRTQSNSRKRSATPASIAPDKHEEGSRSPSPVIPAKAGNRAEGRFFGTEPVSDAVGRALDSMGYEEPTPIQQQIIPLVRAGRDVVGQAQTGTGKTAAFGIPLVERIDRRGREPQALVLAPTRELAVQVTKELSRLGQYASVKVVAIYGGQSMARQISFLDRGVHIIVATPGRLIDHMQRGNLSLENIKSLVLDEADQMLDIGFFDDINYIVRRTPRSRQTLLFSATIPGPIKRLAERYLDDPEWIRVGEMPSRLTKSTSVTTK